MTHGNQTDLVGVGSIVGILCFQPNEELEWQHIEAQAMMGSDLEAHQQERMGSQLMSMKSQLRFLDEQAHALNLSATCMGIFFCVKGGLIGYILCLPGFPDCQFYWL